MKKTWELPVICVQQFEANEYVAACWGVACDVDWPNQYELEHPNKKDPVTHSYTECGTITHQAIITGDDDIPDAMYECTTQGLGDLECTLYSDANFSVPLNITSVSPGMTIYWTTSASNNRVWHHVGTVEETYPGHPNRS